MTGRSISFSTQQNSDKASVRESGADIAIDLEPATVEDVGALLDMTGQGAASRQTAGERLAALRADMAARNPRFAEATVLEQRAEAFCQTIRSGLKAIREARDLTQGDLGKRIDLSQSAVSKIESGDGDLSLKTLFRIAYALDVTPVVSLSSPLAEEPPRDDAQTGQASGEDAKTALLADVEAALNARLPQFLASVIGDLRNQTV
jgi:transcriptional regulator with XRE-family HTH domain